MIFKQPFNATLGVSSNERDIGLKKTSKDVGRELLRSMKELEHQLASIR